MKQPPWAPGVVTTLFASLAAVAGCDGSGDVPAGRSVEAITSADGGCVDDTANRPLLRLAWAAVPDEGASTRLGTEEVSLVVNNPGRAPVQATITVRADAGTPQQGAQRFTVARLDPGQSTTLAIPVRAFGLRTAAMSHAGQITASASAVPLALDAAGGAAPAGPAEPIVAPILYFHRDPATSVLIAYGERVLHDRYHSGDLRASGPDEPDTYTVRIKQGAALPYSADLLAEAGAPDDDGGAAAPGAGFGGPGDVAANVYSLCIKWEIRLTDSGRTVVTQAGQTITEDHWNDPSGSHVVTARGVRVRLTKGSYSQVFDTNPTTGCFTFTHPQGGPFDLRVYAYATDSSGNVTRVRDAEGKTFSFVEKGIVPTLGSPLVVNVGNETPRATLAAIAAFSAYRSRFGLANKQIDIEEVNTCGSSGGNNSSAHHDFSDLANGLAHVRIHDGTSPTCSPSDHRRQKFVVSHELGHAWMLLHTKTAEPAADSSLVDPEETVCGTGNGYTPNSLEWSAIGAREGMAHFYATLVWNNRSTDEAVFSFFGSPANMEHAPPCGGRLLNVCDTPDKAGKSVNMDWARFYWHWHAPYESDSPSTATMRQVYGRAIANGGLARDNYYDKLREALDDVDMPSKVRVRWDHYALQDGASGFACQEPYAYPDCPFEDPEDGAGYPGCPCADVTKTPHVHDLDDDGRYPDGEGSYLAHGMGGVGQFCVDESAGLPKGSVVCGMAPSLGSNVPVCRTCGVDTMVGCPCSNDDACSALGDDLICWGATNNLASESNWKSDLPGRCMPSSATPAGRERLTEVPWICLDNCGAKAGGGKPDTYVCAYDQLDHYLPHAQCVYTNTSSPGYCESKGLHTDVDASCPLDWDDCCVSECHSEAACDSLGFPASYVCDMSGGPGHCVPDGCANPKTLPNDLCSMF
ncbi:hypothetical protein [Sorangium sp. So ce1335]|uniref:hypothetical protein n=1 Tax=Sorangium sp. So ce1335 TaxID=3133335 RepID=UPI003F62EF6C